MYFCLWIKQKSSCKRNYYIPTVFKIISESNYNLIYITDLGANNFVNLLSENCMSFQPFTGLSYFCSPLRPFLLMKIQNAILVLVVRKSKWENNENAIVLMQIVRVSFPFFLSHFCCSVHCSHYCGQPGGEGLKPLRTHDWKQSMWVRLTLQKIY